MVFQIGPKLTATSTCARIRFDVYGKPGRRSLHTFGFIVGGYTDTGIYVERSHITALYLSYNSAITTHCPKLTSLTF